MNSGKLAETWFEQHWASFGKNCFVHRFEDFYESRFKGQGRASKAQPSDYLVTHNGSMLFAEVKSSQSSASFPFKDIRPSQWKAARQQIAANGQYDFFLLNLVTETWYRVPANILLEHRDQGKQSIKWALLEGSEWHPLVDKPTKIH